MNISIFISIIFILLIILIIFKNSYSDYNNNIINNNEYLVIQFDNRDFFTSIIELFNDNNFHKLIKINENYCKKHKLDYMFISSYDNSIPIYWMKVKIIRDILNNGSSYKGIIWLDTDAVFTNMNKSILDIFDNNSFYISKDPPDYNEKSLCVGVWIVKNNNIGKQIMNDWMNTYDSTLWKKINDKWTTTSDWASIAYEQGSFNDYIYPKYKNSIHVLPWYVFNNDIKNNQRSYVSHYMGPKKELINTHFD
jgi:hypothetical protein